MIPNLVEHQHSVKKKKSNRTQTVISASLTGLKLLHQRFFFDAKRTKPSLYNACVHADRLSAVQSALCHCVFESVRVCVCVSVSINTPAQKHTNTGDVLISWWQHKTR